MPGHRSYSGRTRLAGVFAAATAVGALAVASGASASAAAPAAAQTPSSYAGPTIPSPAKRHLKVGVVTCNSALHGCVSPALGVQQAGRKLGWQVTIYNGGGTPGQENASIQDAVSAGANVVVTTAIDPNLVQAGLRTAKRAGVPVVSGSDGIDTPNPVQKPKAGKLGYAFDVAPNYAALGRKAAQWFINNSHGRANVVVFSDKEFPSVMAVQRGLLAGLKQCHGCTVSQPQYFTGTQVGTTLAQQTTGYLQSHPQVDYIYSPYDPAAAAQVSAIEQAGLAHQVKLMGCLGDQQNLAFIRKGQVQVADAAYDNRYMGYAIVDQINRLLAHKKLMTPHGENDPFVILDKTNLPASGADWYASFNYTSRFLKLWQH